MPNQLEIRPFPQIPLGHFDGEVRGPYPTAKDTLLFSNAEKIIMTSPFLLRDVERGEVSIPTEDNAEATEMFRLMATYRESPNSDRRRVARGRIIEAVRQNYPTMYQMLSQAIAGSQEMTDLRTVIRQARDEIKAVERRAFAARLRKGDLDRHYRFGQVLENGGYLPRRTTLKIAPGMIGQIEVTISLPFDSVEVHP